MAEVRLRDVTKDFGSLTAVDAVTWRPLWAARACGKTTTLHMVAGLEEVTADDIYIGEQKMDDAPPKDRDVAMVSQHYSLYPHMDVYNNMAFGLKLRKLPKKEIDRVRDAANLLGITEKPRSRLRALSGGQRVALGRAIVRASKVLLKPSSRFTARTTTAPYLR